LLETNKTIEELEMLNGQRLQGLETAKKSNLGFCSSLSILCSGRKLCLYYPLELKIL